MRNKNLVKTIALASALGLGITVSGCSMLAEKAVKKAVEKSVEDATGEQANFDDKFPEWWPEDVPSPEKYGKPSFSQGSSETTVMWFNFRDRKAYDSYVKDLIAKGFKEKLKQEAESGAAGHYGNGKQLVTMTGGEEDGKFVVMLGITEDTYEE